MTVLKETDTVFVNSFSAKTKLVWKTVKTPIKSTLVGDGGGESWIVGGAAAAAVVMGVGADVAVEGGVGVVAVADAPGILDGLITAAAAAVVVDVVADVDDMVDVVVNDDVAAAAEAEADSDTDDADVDSVGVGVNAGVLASLDGSVITPNDEEEE